MSSIRPLVTITILVVVGAYLYVKINEGSVGPAPGADGAWNQPANDVPPLVTTGLAPTTSDSAAPPWPATTEAPAPTTPPVDVASSGIAAPTAAPPATANAEAATLPAVPAIPEIPEIGTTTQAAASTAPVAPLPIPTTLPANIPEARYPDQRPAAEGSAQADTSIGAAPLVSTAPPNTASETAATAAPPSTASITAQEVATTPEQMNAASATASGLDSAPLALQSNPLRPLAQATPPDRYAATGAVTGPIAPTATAPPVEKSFVESWPAIQAALDRNELAEAHKLLSRWYGDPSLTPTDTERVESLLSQLAGTVVYSTEHQLAPAHVVKPGETLATIAKEYNVPWQLLGKINGISTADGVRAGQELKVVRGPFSAVIDLTRNQLVLMVDGRYAGRVPVSVAPNDPAIHDGEWVVVEKSNPQAPGRALALQGSAATPGAPAPTLVIISDSLPVQSAGSSIIKLAAKDADEITDILSVGSPVVTRR